MKRSTTYILVGAAAGFFIGTSMGIATAGAAINAAWAFVPLGAFIGWLIQNKQSAGTESQTVEEPEIKQKSDQGILESLISTSMTILATMWNFHIDILKAVGVLDSFVRQPLLFVGLCFVLTMIFPPFPALYFCAWLGANQFGISKESKYRAIM